MSRLSLQDVKDAYDVVGALEATVIVDVCSRFTADHLDAMTAINLSMKERQNCREHDEFVELIHTGDGKAAADLLQNRHWSFFDYEGFIRKFYEPLGFEVP